MSNVIRFLEKIGGDARFSHAPQTEISNELDSLEITSELKAAILEKDYRLIDRLLGQEPLCCLMFPVKEDDEENEETPSRDDDEISSSHASHAARLVA